jgi:hypothetical protein
LHWFFDAVVTHGLWTCLITIMMAKLDIHQRPATLLRLSPRDNVAVAGGPLKSGVTVDLDGTPLTISSDVGLGAKIAIVDLQQGEKIIKGGAPIGSLTEDVSPGDYIHTHNLQSDYLKTYDRGNFTWEPR